MVWSCEAGSTGGYHKEVVGVEDNLRVGIGERPRGRLKDQVWKDMKKIKRGNWKELVNGRQKWNDVIQRKNE